MCHNKITIFYIIWLLLHHLLSQRTQYLMPYYYTGTHVTKATIFDDNIWLTYGHILSVANFYEDGSTPRAVLVGENKSNIPSVEHWWLCWQACALSTMPCWLYKMHGTNKVRVLDKVKSTKHDLDNKTSGQTTDDSRNSSLSECTTSMTDRKVFLFHIR